ncbi:probable G-protein coupled receptor Mth-like 3 isoform X2 [Harpegnathos saltator]|uniref:probable G-protein coupled receptor Mth-like 3 isoform X2 n=1 Tax=Harpegnathos saltator TaxID=610380 RepID=UPI00058F06F7|nr:probable G-protein coupled receptor Mth-like 3 isoform X2 [Harpegnathos saltator]
MRVRSAFNSAILFGACGLLIVVTAAAAAAAAADGPLRDDPRCLASLSVVLKNGSGGDDGFIYDGTVYPADLRWTDGNLTYGCICRLRNCIRKCCHSDEVISRNLSNGQCEKMPWDPLAAGDSAAKTPALRLIKEQLAEEIRHIGELREHFVLMDVEGNACPGRKLTFNVNEEEGDEKITIQANGNLFIHSINKMLPPWDFCFDWSMTLDKVGILVCFTQDIQEEENETHRVGMIISIPFLVATFLVYAITPELRNLYGKTLMCYVICLISSYVFLTLVNHVGYISPYFLCIIIAFVIHFSFLASFFWLNVMCFDIWWTFGGFRSLQGSVKQRERKKFIMYSIYAWGCASILTIVCAIMDFVPTVPETFIRPEFGAVRCWYKTDKARAVYFYGPMSVTIICNICLFISTALKIVRHKKDTAHHLRSSESRRHDDNKQWFNLYLKLFIVMGINWSMEIISWVFKKAPPYVWYLSDLTNTLQGLIIFIIFVWKDKIKRLLLRRFGCQERGLFSGNSTRSGCHSSASRTCTTSGVMSLQEKISPYVQTNCRAKNASEVTNRP